MGACASAPRTTETASQVGTSGQQAAGVTASVGLGPGADAKGKHHSGPTGAAEDLPLAHGSYGNEEVLQQGSSDDKPVKPQVSSADADAEPSDASEEDMQDVLKEYTLLAEMLSYSPYPVTLIDTEARDQPIVFANQVFLQRVGYSEPDIVGQSWRAFLQTPFQHSAHSDSLERIREAFDTGCEFREVAACYTRAGDIVTFQLLFLPVSKDVDSGVTHYVCVHMASETTTKAMREADPSSPVALPKLPQGMNDVATARHVSITMKNVTPEQLLGGSVEALGIRVGSFNGSPTAAKIKRPAGRMNADAGESAGRPGAAPLAAVKGKAARSKAKSRFAPAGGEDEAEEEFPASPFGGVGGPMGNLRHDSALMGAITSTKGKLAAPERVPRTKEEVWLQRLRNQLTAPLEEALRN